MDQGAFRQGLKEKRPFKNSTVAHAHGWGLKGTLLFIASLTVLAGAIIAPSLPSITKHLIDNGLDADKAEFWGRMLLSIPALFIMLGSPFVGYVLDRFGRLKVLYMGLTLYAFTGVWAGIYPTLETLLLSRMGLGFAVAMTMVSAITLASDYFKGEERAKFFGIFSSSLSMGGIVYFMMGGFVSELHWRGPFFIYLIAIPAIFFTRKYLFEPERQSEEYSHEEGDVLPKLRIFMIFVTGVMHMGIYFAIPIQLPFALSDQGFTSPMYIAFATSCCSAGVIMMSLNYGRIHRMMSMPLIYAYGFLMVAAGYGGVFLSQSFMHVCISLVFTGLGFGFVLPNNASWLLSITPAPYRGRMSGGLSSSINFGQFLSPIVSFPIVGLYSSRAVFFMFGLLGLCVSLFYLGYNQFRKN